MARTFSIRRRLALQAILTGAVMLCLALSFLWAQWETDRALDRIFKDELAPGEELRRMEAHIQATHSRMQDVLLSHSSAMGALALLEQERKIIHDSWQAFRTTSSNWSQDPDEDSTVADIEAALPELWEFFDHTAAAYRIYDPVRLTELVDTDWYRLQQSLLYNLRNLSQIQERHLREAHGELERSMRLTRLVEGALLLVGLVGLSFLSVHLVRYITRRITDVEQALETVADGETTVHIPYRQGETEMRRIATAVGRTVTRIAEDRNAIASLMHQQQTILSSVAEGIYGVDADGRLMFANQAALNILGYEEHEILGQPSHELLHHHHANGHPYPIADCPIYAARLQGTVVRRDDEVFFRKDGTAFPVEYTGAPLRDLDRPTVGVVVFHDVSVRRQQERILQETIAQLRQTNVRLADTQMQLLQAEKLAGLGQLAAGLAHEINNPLSFINSNFTVLEDYVCKLCSLVDGYETLWHSRPDPEVQLAKLAKLQDEAELEFIRGDLRPLLTETREGLRRVSRIVSDLKDFSRVDLPTEASEVDLCRGLDYTLKVVAAIIDGKAEVIRDYAPLPLVRCHEAQINQVFMNLLLNAAHAIEEEGTITLRTWQQGTEVCIEVSDTGCGMPQSVSARMFEPFFTTRPIGQGRGLGLSVAYSIVKSHNGRFEVNSSPGHGTSIRLWLPIVSQARPMPCAEPQ